MRHTEKYYTWLRDLKNAAIKAKSNYDTSFKKNLNEAFDEDDVIDVSSNTDRDRGAGNVPSFSRKAPASAAARNSGLRHLYDLAHFMEMEKMARAEGEPTPPAKEMYAEYLRALRGKKDSAPPKIDLNNDGSVDGEDSAEQAKDWEQGAYNKAFIKNIDTDLVKPTSATAVFARSEAGKNIPEDQPILQQHAAEQELNRLSQRETEQDTIDSVIDRIVRGKN